MTVPIQLSDTLIEGTTGSYTFSIVDEGGDVVDASVIDALTVTYYDVDAHEVINSRLDQDILGVNGGSITTDPGPPITTIIRLDLDVADTIILDDTRRIEQRVLSFHWTWDGGTKHNRHVVQFGIESLAFVDVA
jgi:hypothetical protein